VASRQDPLGRDDDVGDVRIGIDGDLHAHRTLCQRGGEYDYVKLLDFGLVREITPRDDADLSQFEIMGTPGFIAPELLVIDRPVDERSDLYAVGALGFLMLTGQLPYEEQSTDTMLHAIVNSDPPKPSERTERLIPAALDTLVHLCLSRDPEQRPASAEELGRQLSEITLEESWTEREAEEWWQENPIPSPTPFRRTSDIYSPNRCVFRSIVNTHFGRS
jgi:serine/threonine-protein kinase